MPSGYRTQPIASPDLPPGIPYIIGNEAAERFSFYGMKAILVIFMTVYLHWMTDDPNAVAMGDAEAREYFHQFNAWVYFTPVIGALLADALWGKYRTIIALSLVYCAGHLCLALMGMPPLSPKGWMILGLGLIALGSGGIKPCVSAHVGDQFGKTNSHWLPKVYSWFYFSINLGSFLSTVLTPMLLFWYGPHWAFGVPGILMGIATLVFWMGRHKFVHIPPGGTRFLKQTFGREGIGTLARLSIIYAFIAVFWALFDQTGSSWVQQAVDLDREVLGVTLLPSQVQALNPIFILILIPIFTYAIYPALNRVFRLTEIRKISIGLFLMIGGFAVVAVLQEFIDRGARPSVVWQVLAYLLLTGSEVMVSITALEFAYTQAPQTMKSVIMTLYLLPIAAGNLLTMQINAFIQVPDQVRYAQHAHELWYEPTRTGQQQPSSGEIKRIQTSVDSYGTPIKWVPMESGKYAYQMAGHDRQMDTTDDVFIWYGASGVREGVVTSENQLMLEAEKRVLEFREQSGKLPDAQQVGELLGELRDSWDQPLRYVQRNADTFWLVSLGPDGEYLTRDDVVLWGEVADQEGQSEGELSEGWLYERRQKIVGNRAERETESSESETVDDGRERITVGGHTKLTGASYFWFFTGLMAVTSILFVFVGMTYKRREYLQEESNE